VPEGLADLSDRTLSLSFQSLAVNLGLLLQLRETVQLVF
jgi:hypothetical protein